MNTHVLPLFVASKPREPRSRAVVAILLALVAGIAGPHDATADPLFASPVAYGTGWLPYSVAIANLDPGGHPDLVVVNDVSNSVSVMLGTGTGTFGAKTDFGTGNEPTAVVISDLNGDGKLDLAVANFGSCCDFVGSVSVLLGHGDGIFGVKTDFGTANGPWCIAIGDLNRDSKLDLVTAGDWSGSVVSVLLGNGDGTFGAHTDYPSGNGPRSVAIGDLNRDSKPDLAVANKTDNTVSVLLGNGDGTFGAKTDFGTGDAPLAVAIGDLNGDLKNDVVVANSGTDPNYIGSVSVLLGNGDGSLGTETAYGTGNAPASVAIRDLNGDGKPDLVTANRYGTFPQFAGSVSVLPGYGDGTFGGKTDYVAGSGSRSVAVSDLNGDFRLDLATADSEDNTASVLLNIGTPPLSVGPSSVGLKLRGPVPNPARDLSVSFSLPDAMPATLVVYDTSGREVGRREVGSFGAGPHVAEIGAPGKLAPGVYLVNLIRGNERRVTRAVVIR